MTEPAAARCDAPGCDRPLGADDCQLVVRRRGGERRAYECVCGAVTITLSGAAADDPPIRP
jgi:hypothetical protein